MKNVALFVVILLFHSGLLFSQVAINPNGSPPDASAGLDVNYTNKGFLPPRMTKAELNNISNPAEGLMVYCNDCGVNGTGAMAIFMTGAWRSIFVNDCLNFLSAPLEGTHVPSTTGIIWNWLAVPGASGYRWSSTNNFAGAEEIGTGLTKTQTGLTCNTGYTTYVWAYNSCGYSAETTLMQITSIDPVPPTAGVHIPTPTQIVWNWNAVSGATGYKWSTDNNYSEGEDMGAGLTKTETGLSCNTAYTRYVWAYNTCGQSTGLTLTQSTSQMPFPIAPTEGNHVATASTIEWKWHPVAGAVGYKWNTTNDYSSATQMGTDTTKLETGLGCNDTLTRYVWAYDNCGVSTPKSLTMTTTNETPTAPVAGIQVPTAVRITWNWNSVSGAMGYKWGTTDNYNNATEMGTATSRTETGLNCNTSYTRYTWSYNNCGHSISTPLTQATNNNLPVAPTAGTQIPSYSQIIWFWNTAADAFGYKWNTINDYNSATDMGADTTKTETGLSCNTNYTCYAWAYNSCGQSTAVTLTQSTQTCFVCGNSMNINHVAGNVAPVSKTVTYGTVTNVLGETTKCWITSNLGATHQATAKDDATEASAGWYWQFSLKQGYKHDGTNRTPNTSWITSIADNSDWISANDPCSIELGNGWRIPTKAEWINVDASGGWATWTGPWNSLLKMHAGGFIYPSTGNLTQRGTTGDYWSQTQSTLEDAFRINFNSGLCAISSANKTGGYTLRCIKD